MLKLKKKESLHEMLTCFFCKKYYLCPVTLSCSKNVCGKHIERNQIKKLNNTTRKLCIEY